MRHAIGLFLAGLLIVTGSLAYLRQQPSTASWIVFVGDENLYRMSEQGTVIRQISDERITNFALSPSRDSLAFFEGKDPHFEINITNISGTNQRVLIEETRPRSLVWSPDGTHLAYVAYDKGVPHLIAVDIQTQQRERLIDEQVTFTQSAWSKQRVATQSSGTQGTELLVIDRITNSVTLAATFHGSPPIPAVFSPDGEWLAFAARYAEESVPLGNPVSFSGGNNLYAIYHDGRAMRLVTMGMNIENSLFWVDDWIVLSAHETNAPRTRKSIYLVKPDGSQLMPLTDAELNTSVTDVSPDGKWILAEARPLPLREHEINLLRVSMDGAIVEEISTPFNQVRNAQWSAPVDLKWNPVIILLTGLITGGVYVANRRFVI